MSREVPTWVAAVIIGVVLVAIVATYALLLRRPSGPVEQPPVGKTGMPGPKAQPTPPLQGR
jgi:hypothetical protein